MSPLEKIIRQASERAADFVHFHHDNAIDAGSPLERIMLAAIIAEVKFAGIADYGMEKAVEIPPGRFSSDFLPDNPTTFYIEPQAAMGRYRADLIVHAYNQDNKTWRKLVVECDGHAFHERTKEQAARDRARDRFMQEQGAVVYRFTGSEIYADPCKCAAQVVHWVEKSVFDWE